jgi:hypothetical protein
MFDVFVGLATDMLGGGEPHDGKLQGAIDACSTSPPNVFAMQVIEGEENVIFTTIINQEEYSTLLNNGAEEI